MKSCLEGGYKIVTVAQVGNLVSAYLEGKISVIGVRCYFALLLMQASREAASRTNLKAKRQSPPKNSFSITEIESILGQVRQAKIRRALRELESAGVAIARAGSISLTETPSVEAREWLENSGLKGSRRIPFQRRVLSFLAKSKKKSLIFTTLAYVLRGLFIKRRAISASGTCKRSWIEKQFSLSEGSVKSARAELLRLRLISPDETRSQWKLNRDGAYFSINTAWQIESILQTGRGGHDAKNTEIAPPEPKNASVFAPPIKKQETPYRNLETKKPVSRPSGFWRTKSFKSIKPEDIKRVSSLLRLYQSALEERLFEHTEENLLNFFASAVKAKRTNKKKEGYWRDPVKVFVWTVKNQFKYINDGDEIRAQGLLKDYRRTNPESFDSLDDFSVSKLTEDHKITKAKIEKVVQTIAKSRALAA